MASINQQNITFVSEAEANRLVYVLNTTEDACGWTYRAAQGVDDRWYVQVHDEDGYLIGSL
ncbi:MAG: hypothetical protein ACJ73N_04860 [Bryobacteraceae bacterium]